MYKFFSVTALVVVTLALAACGGSAFTGSTTGTKTVAAATLGVTSSVASIPSDGSSFATITVVAKDANNAAVSGATVAFSASSGNVTVMTGTTDSTGTATAKLVAGTATPGATITVTATSGSVTGTTSVMVANTQKTMTLLTTLTQIPSDGSKTATITAYVRDANNNFVSGQTVGFQASSGGLTVTNGTTDASGSATATLGTAGDPTNRTVTVTAQTGSTTATIAVNIIGTKLTLSGPTTLVQNATGTYTVSLTDAGGNGLANQAITLTSSAGNTLTPAAFTTDLTGQKTFTLAAAKSGNDTITAAGTGLQATAPVAISNQIFAFSAPAIVAPAVSAKVNLNTPTAVTIHWSANNAPQVNQVVNFSSTRGTLSAASMTTDGSGNASVTISSTTAGPALVSATASGVSAQTTIDFVATTPAALKAQASPSTIAPQGKSTITVTVRDAQNNLVEGKAVNFSITQDSTGGSLSVSSATTDSQGQASTVYTASTTTSAQNGVTIAGSIPGTTVTGSTNLTVGGQTVFLSLGTGNTIIPYPPATGANPPPQTQYLLPYSVRAQDNAGNGVDNIQINFTVQSLVYLKGSMVFGPPNTFNSAGWAPQVTTSQMFAVGANNVKTFAEPDGYYLAGIVGCTSEDIENNGILTGNDYNGNGKLDPGGVAATDVAQATTANGGSAYVNIIYPKDHAYWVGIRLTATATVAGTQSSTSTDIWLVGAADDYKTATIAPPGETSPYGLATSCKDPT